MTDKYYLEHITQSEYRRSKASDKVKNKVNIDLPKLKVSKKAEGELRTLIETAGHDLTQMLLPEDLANVIKAEHYLDPIYKDLGL